MRNDREAVRAALDAVAEALWVRYYSRVLDQERYEFQVYLGTRRSLSRWEAVEGLDLWTIGPEAEQDGLWVPVLRRRLLAKGGLLVATPAEAALAVEQRIVALLEQRNSCSSALHRWSFGLRRRLSRWPVDYGTGVRAAGSSLAR